jgi:hypothetical protein
VQPDDREKQRRQERRQELERRARVFLPSPERAAEIREEMARRRERERAELPPFEARLEDARREPNLARKVGNLNELFAEQPDYPGLEAEVEQAEVDLATSQPASRFVHIDAPLVMESEPPELELGKCGRLPMPPAPCMRRGRPPARRRGAGRPAGRRRLATRGDPGDGEPSSTYSGEEILRNAAALVEEAQRRAAEAVEDAEALRWDRDRWRSLCAEVTARLAPVDRETFLLIVRELTGEDAP